MATCTVELEDDMKFRNVIAASVLAMVAASASTVATARTDVDVNIGIGPPPVIVEPIPPPRVGYTWAPGYWGWDGHRHT
jgi:WXXGXW repeat (2 copies)